jgi:outer membrane protein assembly factor BamD
MSIRTILPERPASRCRIALPALLAVLLSACATIPADRAEPGDAAGLYEAGRAALEAGDYPAAIRHFQRLGALFPDDRHTAQGQMELVFAYYQDGDPSSAVAAAGRFIRRHPDHPNLDYLFYLRGLARFDQALQDLAALAATTGPRPPTVDLALQYFSELIGRYPQSRYSADARSRVAHLNRQLAQFELEAAKQHMNRGEYTRARLRAHAVIEHYPDSGLATEAAMVVNMANRMLELEGAGRNPAAERPEVAAEDPARRAPEPAESPDGGPRGEDWIRQQDGAAWTIQLFGTANEQALLSFVSRHELDEAAWFRSTRDREPWYTLIYGIYDDIDAARGAVERLPRAVLGGHPWIRRMSGIHAILDLETLERAETR